MCSQIFRRRSIDRAVLESLLELQVDGQPDVIVELASIFLEATPPRIERLCKAVERSDRENVIAEAHALKSSAANLGADRLSALTKELERVGAMASLPELLVLARAVQSEFERARGELLELIAERQGTDL
jgi:HPt (histidine-containing phosphotransfer) domain-containing protein